MKKIYQIVVVFFKLVINFFQNCWQGYIFAVKYREEIKNINKTIAF